MFPPFFFSSPIEARWNSELSDHVPQLFSLFDPTVRRNAFDSCGEPLDEVREPDLVQTGRLDPRVLVQAARGLQLDESLD